MTSAPVALVVELNTIDAELVMSHRADNPGEFEATLLTFRTASD